MRTVTEFIDNFVNHIPIYVIELKRRLTDALLEQSKCDFSNRLLKKSPDLGQIVIH